MTRSVPEWIGSSPDAKVPTRVRIRVFEREGGRCHLTGRRIMPGEDWDLDHKLALANGGQHRENNLFPALRFAHREKTADDVRVKSKIARRKAKHLGLHKSPHPLRSKNTFQRSAPNTRQLHEE